MKESALPLRKARGEMRADRLKSSPFGCFNPVSPERLPGIFAANVLTEPLDIYAPPDLVWRIMVDFDRYGDWNPLNRFFRLDARAAAGETVTFGPRWGPYDSRTLGSAAFTQRETITVWEEDRCLAYAAISPWLKAERVQYIARMADDQSRYYTYERTAGLLAPMMRRIYAQRIVEGFTANGIALKQRAEAAYTAETGT